MVSNIIAIKFNGAKSNFPNSNFVIFIEDFELLSRLAQTNRPPLLCACSDLICTTGFE